MIYGVPVIAVAMFIVAVGLLGFLLGCALSERLPSYAIDALAKATALNRNTMERAREIEETWMERLEVQSRVHSIQKRLLSDTFELADMTCRLVGGSPGVNVDMVNAHAEALDAKIDAYLEELQRLKCVVVETVEDPEDA